MTSLQQPSAHQPAAPQQPPTPVRLAGIIAIVQCAVGLGYAGLLIVRELLGKRDPSLVSDAASADYVGLGTAVFFVIVFGTVLAGAISMMKGKKWGRGPVVILNLILLPISFTMFSAHAYLFGIVTLLAAVVGLGMLFNRTSVAWAAELHNRGR